MAEPNVKCRRVIRTTVTTFNGRYLYQKKIGSKREAASPHKKPWKKPPQVIPAVKEQQAKQKKKEEKLRLLEILQEQVRKDIQNEMEKEYLDSWDLYSTTPKDSAMESRKLLSLRDLSTRDVEGMRAGSDDSEIGNASTVYLKKGSFTDLLEMENAMKMGGGGSQRYSDKRRKPGMSGTDASLDSEKEDGVTGSTYMPAKAAQEVDKATTAYHEWLKDFCGEFFPSNMSRREVINLFTIAVESRQCPTYDMDPTVLGVLPITKKTEVPRERDINRWAKKEFADKPRRKKEQEEAEYEPVPLGVRHVLYGDYYYPVKKWYPMFVEKARLEPPRPMSKGRVVDLQVKATRDAKLAELNMIEHYNSFLENSGRTKPSFMRNVMKMKREEREQKKNECNT